MRSLVWLLLAVSAFGAPKRVLHVTHSAGFRHDSIVAARQAFEEIAAQSGGTIEVESTEDLSTLNAERLRAYDAVFFFTSGELAIDNLQKSALLAFVREGKGFGGAHSATDTLYSWPEYGEMIGGYFDGHPWVHEASVDVEDPQNPIVGHLGPSFRFVEEFYQFRAFSRERVRVLMTLDPATIDLKLPGVNRQDKDFALAWVRPYGQGRVFYTALGHFDETWRDPRFRSILREALLWLTGQKEMEAAPRPAAPSLASVSDIAPGGLFTITGRQLTPGSASTASTLPLPVKLGGSVVEIDGQPVPLLSVGPERIEAQAPFTSEGSRRISVTAAGVTATADVRVDTTAPRILGITRSGEALSIYATGLGATVPGIGAGTAAPSDPMVLTLQSPEVYAAGQQLTVGFSGLAPGFVALYQVNAVSQVPMPPGPIEVELRIAGKTARASVEAK